MSFDVAACLDPLSIALHVAMHAKIEVGDSVLVNGAGAQGLYAIICAKTMGAGLIMCSDTGNRLEAAERLGAVPIDFTKDDVVDKVMELTGGLGAKRVMECTGNPIGVKNACYAAARGGCISVIGLPKDDPEIPVKRLVLDEIEFVGNRANPNTLEKSIPMALQHHDEMKSLITHVFPMTEYEKAMDIFVGMKDNSVKVVMKPQLV
jgi:threonine dehydrogenase-like Zn-dependent dehydrogenase